MLDYFDKYIYNRNVIKQLIGISLYFYLSKSKKINLWEHNKKVEYQNNREMILLWIFMDKIYTYF